MKATVNGTQRKAIARDVAARALRDAHRNGLNADDLVRAIRAAEPFTHSK
jgi:hypothetical protein